MDILDRFLDVKTSYLKDKKEYEKAVIASLLISTKLYADEYICPKELLQLTSSSITSRDIMDTAVDIYESLSWNHSIPTAARFVHTLVKLLPENFTKKSRADIFENAIYQIELSVQDAICSSQPASLVAWMAVENGLETAIFLSPDERHEFRSRVSKTTGHEYSTELRNRLRGFQANVVLSDETKEIHHVSLKPRSLKDIPVVSMHEIDLV